MKRIWFNLWLLSNGEIPIKEVNVVALISLLKGHKFTVSQVCHHFDNKQYWTCWFLQRCFFSVGRKLECTKIHDLFGMVAECYAGPHFGVHIKVWPHPICTNPPPLINDWSLNTLGSISAALSWRSTGSFPEQRLVIEPINTPPQRHYSSCLLISAF